MEADTKNRKRTEDKFPNVCSRELTTKSGKDRLGAKGVGGEGCDVERRRLKSRQTSKELRCGIEEFLG